jgi:hypothetical protein
VTRVARTRQGLAAQHRVWSMATTSCREICATRRHERRHERTRHCLEKTSSALRSVHRNALRRRLTRRLPVYTRGAA